MQWFTRAPWERPWNHFGRPGRPGQKTKRTLFWKLVAVFVIVVVAVMFLLNSLPYFHGIPLHVCTYFAGLYLRLVTSCAKCTMAKKSHWIQIGKVCLWIWKHQQAVRRRFQKILSGLPLQRGAGAGVGVGMLRDGELPLVGNKKISKFQSFQVSGFSGS